MDFGDLLILFFIVSSIVSTIAGGKKKRERAKRLPQSRPQRPPAGAPPAQRPRATGAPARRPPSAPFEPDPGSSKMEDILRQLGLEVEPEQAPAPEPKPRHEPEPSLPRRPRVETRDPVDRPMPRVVSLEGESLESKSGETKRHKEFRDEYVSEFKATSVFRPESRASVYLDPTTLRKAILYHEILGPPKGLR